MGAGSRHANILIKTGKCILKASRKPQSATQENPFTVINVVYDLTNCPLSRRVTMERLLVRDSSQERICVLELRCEFSKNIVAWHQINVARVVRGSFIRLWMWHDADR